MKIRQIIGALEEFAPLALQDGYDNAGLQIGLAEDAEASGALLCLDVTEDVLAAAVALPRFRHSDNSTCACARK